MATPITHILLAEKVFSKYFSDKDKGDFYRGTVFPDIRYLGEIKRNETHFKDVALSEIKKESSFFAGFKFHSLVDKIRERFIREQNLYSFFPSLKHLKVGVKLIEDKLLYPEIKNWDGIRNHFNRFSEEEFSFGVSRNGVEKWHGLLKSYFSKQPEKKTMIKFLSELEMPEGMLEEMEPLLKRLDDDPRVIKTMLQFYKEFEKLLEEENYFWKMPTHKG
jgi:hypothetical protein